MKAEDRRAVREKLATVSPRTLRDALAAVLSADAEAQKAQTDDPGDEKLGWFADGTDTAAARVYAAVLGREPAVTS